MQLSALMPRKAGYDAGDRYMSIFVHSAGTIRSRWYRRWMHRNRALTREE